MQKIGNSAATSQRNEEANRLGVMEESCKVRWN